MIAAPVAARSKLQSDPWVCQFHWPLTEIVTVPLPLSIAVALIVPRIGLLASPNAPATRNVTEIGSVGLPVPLAFDGDRDGAVAVVDRSRLDRPEDRVARVTERACDEERHRDRIRGSASSTGL